MNLKWFTRWFGVQVVQANEEEYMRGRGDGWFACENLILHRAKAKDPALYQAVLDLLQ